MKAELLSPSVKRQIRDLQREGPKAAEEVRAGYRRMASDLYARVALFRAVYAMQAPRERAETIGLLERLMAASEALAKVYAEIGSGRRAISLATERAVRIAEQARRRASDDLDAFNARQFLAHMPVAGRA